MKRFQGQVALVTGQTILIDGGRWMVSAFRPRPA